MTALAVRFRRALFGRVVAGVLDTPPLARGTLPFTLLSMVHHRDVLPYLLAVKSFAVRARPERIVVVADPSLDADDRAVLQRHVPFVETCDAARFRRPALPVGGTWERLAAIAAMSADGPIVQLDADTLTFAPPTEVVDGVLGGASFAVRSEAGAEIVDLSAAAAEGRRRAASSRHVQVAVESRLTELPDAARFRYVRGCSGFTGFGRGAIEPALLDDVSAQMRELHGARWDEWGTEQVTSNLLAASAPGAFLPPHPKYCNADSLAAGTAVAHYIGYARHVDRGYERRAAAEIASLRCGGTP